MKIFVWHYICNVTSTKTDTDDVETILALGTEDCEGNLCKNVFPEYADFKVKRDCNGVVDISLGKTDVHEENLDYTIL